MVRLAPAAVIAADPHLALRAPVRAPAVDAEEEEMPRARDAHDDGVDAPRPRGRPHGDAPSLTALPAELYGRAPPAPIDLTALWAASLEVVLNNAPNVGGPGPRPRALDVLATVFATHAQHAGLRPDPAQARAWVPLAEAAGIGAVPFWLAAAHDDRGLALDDLTEIMARLVVTPKDAAAVVEAARALFDRELLLAVRDGFVRNRSLPEPERARHLDAVLKIDDARAAQAAPGAFAVQPPNILELRRLGLAHADPAVRAIFARALADANGIFARLAPALRREAVDALCTDGDFQVRKAAGPLFWQASPHVHQTNHDRMARQPGTWADGEHLRALLDSAPPHANPYVLVHLIGKVNSSDALCAAAGKAMLRSTTMPFEQRHQYMLHIAEHSNAPAVRDCVVEHLALAAAFAVQGADRDKLLEAPVLATLLLNEDAPVHRVADAVRTRARDLVAADPAAHPKLAAHWPVHAEDMDAMCVPTARIVLVASRPISGITLSRTEATRLLVRTGGTPLADMVPVACRAIADAPSVRGLADRLGAIDVLCAHPELHPSALQHLLTVALPALVTRPAVAELGLDGAPGSSPLPRVVFERLVARLGDPRLPREAVIAVLDAVLNAARAGANGDGIRPFLACAARLGLDGGILRILADASGCWGPEQVAPLPVPPDGLRAATLALSPEAIFRRHVEGFLAVDGDTALALPPHGDRGDVLHAQSTQLERLPLYPAQPGALCAAIIGVGATRVLTPGGTRALVASLTHATLPPAAATDVLMRLLARTLPPSLMVGSRNVPGTRMALEIVDAVLRGRADIAADDQELLRRAVIAVHRRVRIDADPEPARLRGLASIENAFTHQGVLRPVSWRHGRSPLPLHPNTIDLGHGLQMAYVKPVVPNGADPGVAPFDRAGGDVVIVDVQRGAFVGRLPLAPVGAQPRRRAAEVLWAASGRLPEVPPALLNRAQPDALVPVTFWSDATCALRQEPPSWPVAVDQVALQVPVRVNVKAIEELAAALPELGTMKLRLDRVGKNAVRSTLRVTSTGRPLALAEALGTVFLALDRGGVVENVNPARPTENGYQPNALRLTLVWEQKAGDAIVRRELFDMDAPERGLHFDLVTLAQTTRRLLALDVLAQEQA